MKKWLFLLFLSPKLFALYMGNPASPTIIEEGFFFAKTNWLSIKAGYERDWVFDRGMRAVSKLSGRFDNFDFISDQGVFTFNVINRVEVYGKLGAARFSAANRPVSSIRHEYETHDQFAWGIGGRGTFLTWNALSFGISGEYWKGTPRIKWLTVNGAPVKPSGGSKLKYDEWQVGLGASYEIDIFVPYIGLKYSNASVCFRHLPPGFLPNGRYFKGKSRRKFGMALGTTLSNGERFAASVEARFIDEQSITVAGEVRF